MTTALVLLACLLSAGLGGAVGLHLGRAAYRRTPDRTIHFGRKP